MAFCLMISLVKASGFGVVQTKRYFEVKPGETVDLVVHFFTAEDQPVRIKVSVDLPNGWKATVVPEEFEIVSSKGSLKDKTSKYVQIPGKGFVKTFPVHVFVQVPLFVEKNLYKLNVVTFSSEKGEGTIKVTNKRIITFRFNVTETHRFVKVLKRIKKFASDTSKVITGKLAGLQEFSDILYVWSITFVIISFFFILDKLR